MEILSNISVPLLLIFMVFVLFTSLGGSEWDVIIAFEGSGGIGIREAISAVVGFSNSINSTIISPALTTVDQPGDKIGRTAVRFLIEEIENPTKNVVTKTVEIKTSLIVRDSSHRA